jgi:hypothetical protein
MLFFKFHKSIFENREFMNILAATWSTTCQLRGVLSGSYVAYCFAATLRPAWQLRAVLRDTYVGYCVAATCRTA